MPICYNVVCHRSFVRRAHGECGNMCSPEGQLLLPVRTADRRRGGWRRRWRVSAYRLWRDFNARVRACACVNKTPSKTTKKKEKKNASCQKYRVSGDDVISERSTNTGTKKIFSWKSYAEDSNLLLSDTFGCHFVTYVAVNNAQRICLCHFIHNTKMMLQYLRVFHGIS